MRPHESFSHSWFVKTYSRPDYLNRTCRVDLGPAFYFQPAPSPEERHISEGICNNIFSSSVSGRHCDTMNI
ncbi:unnamed protein product [Chondrus crispus]|uniref:Uncharacterized protein n=1 Tax=Chondrus crispus TaxID=2769 RepID=R7QGY4_CHOCR|nr:unnamed protein product [Chondrus crispus]CDF36983.1 unnamed protein product [Chondrus crispus]|eukprot:XP_005716802.1 unnamed protein product [Chondrus crispus]